MRRRCQPNSVSGVTSHPARLGRGSAAAIAPSKLRSASVISGRSTCRRSTPSWWRNTMISRSFERPDRTVSRASDARNRYKIRYTTNQHRPTSRQVNDHGRVSGTHTLSLWLAATSVAELTAAAATSPHSSRRCSPAPAPQRNLTRGPTLTRRRDAGWIPAPTPRNLATRRSRAAPTQLEDHRCPNETPQRTPRCGNN